MNDAVLAAVPCGHDCLCDGGIRDALVALNMEECSLSKCPMCREVVSRLV